ncbi:RNA polymerase sigma factor [Dinghuibacter silviterrae]|uniref:RNA polymerase sigma-70 factor (ECF subfamily) n=1 Tax=Dinghuibacter silviterrae TaxID=1539049 RepID=A0A4R8DS49_9BACT|nr:sigma-70 family RNA polymerase sigma factor [Dinghuibacter silviterrae]TDX01040.1 RNA polymerase sigma-70 factor (ECF subfamily) [Dinghuibacter silviterrae]
MSEHQVIQGCIEGDVRCQRMLFERYAGKMLMVCLRYASDHMEAEDILQNGFIKVFRHIGQFKYEGSFEGWVRKVMVNTALKYCQRKRIRFDELQPDMPQVPGIEPYVYSLLGEADLLHLIRQLPEGYRLVFNLHVIEGYSHEEIAGMLNIKDSTSRSQLVKARRMLQQAVTSLHKTTVAV